MAKRQYYFPVESAVVVASETEREAAVAGLLVLPIVVVAPAFEANIVPLLWFAAVVPTAVLDFAANEIAAGDPSLVVAAVGGELRAWILLG